MTSRTRSPLCRPPGILPALTHSVRWLCLLLLRLQPTANDPSTPSSTPPTSFIDPPHPGPFQRLVTDPSTGRVYVAATNRLYQLREDLSLEAMAVTGPHNDNPLCPPPSSECHCVAANCPDFFKFPMDAVNKALVVDQRGSRLIACVDLFQGHCERYSLANITVKDEPVWSMVVPNDPVSSTVMFVAPGPPNPASTNVLYVAATRSARGLPAYRDIVPAIALRSLHDLSLVAEDILTSSRMDVEIQQRDLFRVRYVHGWSSMGFSYLLTVQRTTVMAADRVCDNLIS